MEQVTALEDEQNLDKVWCDLELFEACAKGFIEGCGGKLSQEEIKLLPMGARLMTYECGMRGFLWIIFRETFILKFTDQGRIWTGQGHSLNLSLIWNISGK